MQLEALFPDSNYRFHLGVQRGDARAFFAPQDVSGRLLAERTRWIDGGDVQRYVALESEGRAVFEEFSDLLREWGMPVPEHMVALAKQLEPDVLFLTPDTEGRLRLRGGTLVFPTSWTLEEKLGHPLATIHGPVPGLNAAIGEQLDRMLPRLAPGVAWCRTNWGLAATDELNMHSARGVPAPALPLRLDRLWLRVEHQALVAMPRCRGLVFGIRIELQRMDEMVSLNADAARGLARAMRTMTPEMARYKRIDAIAPALIARLEDTAGRTED